MAKIKSKYITITENKYLLKFRLPWLERCDEYDHLYLATREFNWIKIGSKKKKIKVSETLDYYTALMLNAAAPKLVYAGLDMARPRSENIVFTTYKGGKNIKIETETKGSAKLVGKIRIEKLTPRQRSRV